MTFKDLNRILGNMDIYLLDQVLKGRFNEEMKILDAGCGEGRNCVFFLHSGFQIFGVDQNATAIKMARVYAKTIAKDYDLLRFQMARIEDMPFHKGAFDVILSSAVLHFSKNTAHFFQMMDEMVRILRPNGILWLRMASGYGSMMEQSIALGEGLYQLPDGTVRFLLTKNLFEEVLEKYSFQFLETPKSVLVHGQRAMGVFLLQKGKN